jgi:acyl carrier protein
MDIIKKQIEYLIADIIRRYINRNFILANPSADLKNDLGFDSIDLKILTVKIETKFHIFIYDEELTKIRTISDIVNIVIKKKHPELLVKE